MMPTLSRTSVITILNVLPKLLFFTFRFTLKNLDWPLISMRRVLKLKIKIKSETFTKDEKKIAFFFSSFVLIYLNVLAYNVSPKTPVSKLCFTFFFQMSHMIEITVWRTAVNSSINGSD